MTWVLGLLLLGFFFLTLEFFVPSSGILGVLATLCIVGSLVMAFRVGLGAFTFVLLTVIVVVPSSLIAAARYWPDTPIGRRIVIRPPQEEEVLPESSGSLKKLIGQRGKAKSDMLPSGAVVIQGRTYDAIGDGMAINAGQPIIVTGLDMQVLIVRPDDAPIAAELAGEARIEDPLARPVDDPFEDVNS
jgi:membrane-bound ClpP family serine protease